MTRRFDTEVLEERARNLEAAQLNGLDRVEVELEPVLAPDHAILTVAFHNGLHLPDLDTAVNVDGVAPTDLFVIRGGSRLRGGEGPGEVQVTQLGFAVGNELELRVEPIGDYSTYSLRATYADAAGDALVDPLFEQIDFKFRPGCFNINCAPDPAPSRPPSARPTIDYLAKDFDSFRHVLVNAMRERVPDWEPTSEADLDQVILDLLAADGDEISDYQDRVMQEAYLGRARKRVSLARHARLMDYHIHQGNQASTWLLAEVANEIDIPAGHGVWSGTQWSAPGAVVFITDQVQRCFPQLNQLQLYDWGEAVISLDAGSVYADLALPGPLDPLSQADAEGLRDLFRRDDVAHLAIEEKRNPQTGTLNGRDVGRRQLLQLRAGEAAAEALEDPLTHRFFVRVHWRAQDALRERYCILAQCDAGPVAGISALHANLVLATQGRPHHTVFLPPGLVLPVSDPNDLIRRDYLYWQATPWGKLCGLPVMPLAYRDTPPGGIRPTETTLQVGTTQMDATGAWSEGAGLQIWSERSDLIESQGDDEHFIVETDERKRSRLRFGNGVNGARLSDTAVVVCDYQVGQGAVGNVGADSLTGFEALTDLNTLRNPFDVINGRDSEPVAEIIRRVPVAYRARQLRAVTLADYVQRAEELPEVAHAYARYRWTGSWRTVRVAIDPAGSTVLDDQLRRRIQAHLDAVRLIGEDLEVRPARYVPLDVELTVCADAAYWPEDLAQELAREFSEGYTPSGDPGFFHPDVWSFGQDLHASQVMGRALRVTGVDRVVSLSMRRFHPGAGSELIIYIPPEALPQSELERIEVRPWEIVRVSNDPNHLEHGRIQFDIQGGRR
ncbi:MAG: baseplate J/gp47 family protein [Sedimenticolaceae bacterium]|jgi:hypothetical protein